MVEAGVRGGICQAVHISVKANNRYMNSHDKSKKSSYIQYYDASSLYTWAICQKLPVNGFKWEKNILIFKDDFINFFYAVCIIKINILFI